MARGKSPTGSSVPHRGQLTVEALMVGAMALGLLLLAAVAITRMQAAQTDLFSRRILQTENEGLEQYVDEICVLGIGNARTLELAPISLNLTAEDNGRTLTVWRGNWSNSRHVICPVQINGYDFGPTAYLWYEAQPDGSPGAVISPMAHP